MKKNDETGLSCAETGVRVPLSFYCVWRDDNRYARKKPYTAELQLSRDNIELFV
jgi:hypothetical protein